MRNTGIKLAIISTSFLFACNSKPQGLIKEKEMAPLVADLKMLEARVDQLYLRSIDSSRMVFNQLEKDVFKKHDTDSSAYAESYDYYLKRKKKMIAILEEAEKILEKSFQEKTDTLTTKPNVPESGNNTNL